MTASLRLLREGQQLKRWGKMELAAAAWLLNSSVLKSLFYFFYLCTSVMAIGDVQRMHASACDPPPPERSARGTSWVCRWATQM